MFRAGPRREAGWSGGNILWSDQRTQTKTFSVPLRPIVAERVKLQFLGPKSD